MSSADPNVTEPELHAYADGQLAPAEAERVEAWLAQHPEDAARVRNWRSDMGLLRAAYADVEPPVLAAAAPPARRAQLSWAAAAAIAFLAFGLGSGAGFVTGARVITGAAGDAPVWAEAGVSAHNVFVSEVRHPVEVAAAEREHLVKWLSNRLGEPIEAPDLSGLGLKLLGGRLLAEEGKPAAMLMYEDPGGARFTLVAMKREGERETAFRIWDSGGVSAVYWVEGPLGYVLAGEAERGRLLAIAHEVYSNAS